MTDETGSPASVHDLEGPVVLYASVGPPTGKVYGIGPFDTAKDAREWLADTVIPLWPTLTMPLIEPAALWLCAHCGDLGPVGTDHSCSCPYPDADCPHHGWKATSDGSK